MSTASVQCRPEKPNTRANKLQSSWELAGRFAAVGYSAVVIGMTRGLRPVNGACVATTWHAKPYHVVTPPDVKWYVPQTSSFRKSRGAIRTIVSAISPAEVGVPCWSATIFNSSRLAASRKSS